jgi:CubicO group peptidase (beta-lactamase class C family)
MTRIHCITLAVLAIALAACTEVQQEATSEGNSTAERRVFEPAESKEENLAHHRRVPDDDIWWNVTGEEMGWLHRNVQQLFPTVNVYRDGPVRELEYNRMSEVADFVIDTPAGPMRFADLLEDDQSTAMGVVILHKGKIVFESYPRMREHEKITYWSTVKVLGGAVLRILEERGEVDTSLPIGHYIPDLAESSFAGITVRNLLDMATGLDCEDEYYDRTSCYYQYSMAIGDGFRDETAPDNPYDYLGNVKLKKLAEQGTEFSYSGANNFLLSWLIEEITGLPFQDVFTREFWWHIGAESDASFIAYRYGIPLSHGGFLSKMRDLARFGLLYTPSYSVVSDRQIISDSHIEYLLHDSNPNLVRDGRLSLPYSSSDTDKPSGPSVDGDESDPVSVHNSSQWGYVDSNGYMMQGGWGGQGLIVNPELDLVAVFTSYFKDDYSEIELNNTVFGVLTGVFGTGGATDKNE